jgi:RHS repeat-associated protein
VAKTFAPSSGTTSTLSYQFDGNASGGLGQRTSAALTGSLTGTNTSTYGTFARLSSFATSGSETGALGTPVNQTFDATGQVATRAPADATDTMTWDALGRLIAVARRDGSNNGFNWTAVYDGLGRRLQTTQQTVSGGTASGTPLVIQSSYDPEVEFMELAVTTNGQRDWLVRGPDISGAYGAMQGTGGIEAVFNATSSTTTGVISDIYGHTEATVVGTTVTWNAVHSTGYGPAPGNNAVPIDGSHDISEALAWRGHYIDATGYYYMGARYYAPDSGTFLSCDPLGHAASMDLYNYADGDPVNGFDPDGRCVDGFDSGESNSIAADAPNSLSFDIGNLIGAAWSGTVEGAQQEFTNGINEWGQASQNQSTTWQELMDPNTRDITAETMLFSAERTLTNEALGLGGTLSGFTDPTGLSKYEFGYLQDAANQEFNNIGQNLGIDYNSAAGQTASIYTGAAVFGATLALGGPEAEAAEEAGAAKGLTYCFPKGTKVETPTGKRNIEDIKVGDKVLSYDLGTKKVVERTVTQLIRKATQHWYHIQVGDEVIKATGAHPFWVVNKGRWISARDLKPGMELRKFDGNIVKISSVEMEKLTTPEGTYNMEVEHDHDYFAGTAGCTVLVHNTDPNDILFSRDPAAINSSTTFGKLGPWANRTLGDAVEEAKALGQLPEGLTLNASWVVGPSGDVNMVTANNRTLWVAQQAGLQNVSVQGLESDSISKIVDTHLGESGGPFCAP